MCCSFSISLTLSTLCIFCNLIFVIFHLYFLCFFLHSCPFILLSYLFFSICLSCAGYIFVLLLFCHFCSFPLVFPLLVTAVAGNGLLLLKLPPLIRYRPHTKICKMSKIWRIYAYNLLALIRYWPHQELQNVTYIADISVYKIGMLLGLIVAVALPLIGYCPHIITLSSHY